MKNNPEQHHSIDQVDISAHQPKKAGEAFQNMMNYLDELGLFAINGANPDNPLTFEQAQAFEDALTPEQRKKLAELEAAYMNE